MSAANVLGVVYPGRPVLGVLPKFRGTAGVRQTPEQRAALLTFVREHYLAGRSLRELGELTGRSQAAIRGALDQAGVVRRGRGAPSIRGGRAK